MRKHSFTLIEMLIVVVIIGILAAALIPRLQSVQARARDTKRKADLHQIGTALEIYKEDNWGYNSIRESTPGGREYQFDGAGWPIASTQQYVDQYWAADPTDTHRRLYNVLQKYMTSIPTDPDTTQRVAWMENNMVWYYGAFMGRNQSNNTAPGYNVTLNSVVLTARTESDGSSSNWVTNSNNTSNTDKSTWDSQWIRAGMINAENLWDGNWSASVYEKYLCTKVTFDSGTWNDGGWNCGANKDWNDLRYIYVQ